jgi:hypothetical protein
MVRHLRPSNRKASSSYSYSWSYGGKLIRGLRVFRNGIDRGVDMVYNQEGRDAEGIEAVEPGEGLAPPQPTRGLGAS